MNSNILFSLRNKQSCLFLNKESALKQGLERTLFLFRTSRIPLLVSAKGDIIFARPYGGIQGVRGFLWCVGEGLCPSRGRPQGSPLRSVTRSAVGRANVCIGPYGGVVRSVAQTKGGPAGRPYGFYIHFLYTLCGVLRRINLPGAGVCLCRPTRCGPRPGVFPGRWLFPPGRSRCGVRPGSPGPGL